MPSSALTRMPSTMNLSSPSSDHTGGADFIMDLNDASENDASSVGGGSSSSGTTSTPSSKPGDGSSSRSSGGSAFLNSGGYGSRSKGSKNETNQHFEEENKRVKVAKCLVGFAFLACAVAMIVSVYLIAKSSDQQSFEIEYEGYVKDILALVIWEVRYNFALMEQLSAQTTIASHLMGNSSSSWPYHTEPEFEMTGGFVDGMGGIMSAGFAPFVTSEEQRNQWEEYSFNQADEWIANSAYLKEVNPTHRDALHNTIQDHEHDRRRLQQQEEEEEEQPKLEISKSIFHWEDGRKIVEPPADVYAPLWQISPATHSSINANLLSDPRVATLFDVMIKSDRAVLSQGFPITDLFDFLFDESEKPQKQLPHGFILMPIYRDIVEKQNHEMVGFLIGVTVFTNLFDRLLPEGRDGIIAVLDDVCGQTMTFELTDSKAKFLGYEDLHESEFDEYGIHHTNLEMYTDEEIDSVNSQNSTLCTHDLSIYPTSKFRQTFESNSPAIYAGVVALAFVGTALLMLLYDFLVNRRQSKTVQVAARTQAIVTSLFPKDIGRKLVAQAVTNDVEKSNRENKGGAGAHDAKGWKVKKSTGGQNKLAEQALKEHDEDMEGQNFLSSKPMADLFPEATVMFGDIVGFTAWSSTREPTQVFMLLESLYSSFDKIALKRKVMKIETVGDCYVAVCGLPDPRKDHATTMVRFARDILEKMHTVLHNLTITLGPDTTDLGIRVGLNSGPVTAGVLRGDRARFQLFGDTVNTTARIESNGAKNRIHCSEATAKLLIAAGKDSWVTPRQGKINAKGKGEMQTYWVHSSSAAKSVASTSAESNSCGSFEMDPLQSYIKSRETNKRVIDWICELLGSLLKDVVARRQTIGLTADLSETIKAGEQRILKSTNMPLNEVKEVIKLPKFKEEKKHVDASTIQLSTQVQNQLREYVLSIDKLYNENNFHSFEHATHVTMSVVKLLKRIVAPIDTDGDLKNLHDHTFGITSDPLTQFSVVLAALIHDVDHCGVSNTQLLAEETETATLYKGKSIAEQNSIDLAWSILMEDQFETLRRTIYTTEAELYRFRQMVVHTVCATDIMDKEFNQKRKERWFATFPDETSSTESTVTNSVGSYDDEVDRKATIVIEHLMQASDVAHTMQHWHVYSKWNGRLFKEMYKAYKDGRSAKDPSTFWYEGEIGFLDHYVIPLAMKLQKCGVFGVFSDEYLNYAQENRREWVEKGQEVVDNLMKEIESSNSS